MEPLFAAGTLAVMKSCNEPELEVGMAGLSQDNQSKTQKQTKCQYLRLHLKIKQLRAEDGNARCSRWIIYGIGSRETGAVLRERLWQWPRIQGQVIETSWFGSLSRAFTSGKGGEGVLGRCSQSRVGVLASSSCGNSVLGSNVARGGLGYSATGSNVLDVHQWACLRVDRGRVELEKTDLGVLPGILLLRDSAKDVTVSHDDDVLFGSAAEILSDPLRTVVEMSLVSSVESLLAVPVWSQGREVEALQLGVALENLLGGTSVAWKVVAFLELRKQHNFVETA